jgi:chemotaxis protein MotB
MAANSMSTPLLPVRLLCLTMVTAVSAGCGGVPMSQFRAAQYQTLMTHRQLAQTSQIANQLASEKQQLEQMTAQLHGELGVANQRLANLGAEREELTMRYANLLTSLQNSESPLGGAATKRFEELARKYPEFEFDPYTGVSKFTGDLLFASGSADIRGEGQPLLQEFARIMNDPEARQFNILVVGHTDDQPVAKSATKNKHRNNWELSAHRATSVVTELSRYGLTEQRLGVAGYSMYQPVAPNANEPTRQQNRRVEIYILAPDASIASVEPRPYF